VGAVLSPGPVLARATAVLASAGVLLLAVAASLVPGLLAADCAANSSATAPPSATAQRTIPAAYMTLYRQAGAAAPVPWPLLAAIGAIESDHGRSTAPGIQSGVNAFGCCAGPMQFNLRNGPPSTWQNYRVDGDADGDTDPYNPADAIASAAHYLQTLITRTRGDIAAAVFGYNHSPAYVADVLAFSADAELATAASAGEAANTGMGCAAETGSTGGTAELQGAEPRTAPRAYATLPAWAMAARRTAQSIDARLLEDALWLLRTYRLRVTAAREGGHNTHGDGTALGPCSSRPGRPGRLGPDHGRPRPRSRLDADIEYIPLGPGHMLLGWDHLLLVLGIVPLARQMKRAAKLTSPFVAGDSLTLILGTMFEWRLSPSLVDAIIALSVVFVAALGLRGPARRQARQFVHIGLQRG
jgi:hypothetical protein